jgi:glycosyltransferase involved in cell wall biosynthesis
MKILHLVYSGLGGGMSVVFSLIEGNKNKLITNEILFSGPQIHNDIKYKTLELNTKFSYIKTIKLLSFFYYFSILIKIINHKPKVILLHNFLIIPCILYKIIFPKTIIIYINHTPINKFTLKDFIIRKCNLFINKFVCLNKEAYFFYKKKLQLSKITYITNGININFFSQLNVKKNKFFKIGMACRVNLHKKYSLIAHALLSKNIRDLNIKFSLAGDGEDLNNFREKIKKLNLYNNKIKLEGYLDEKKLKKWYNTLDLYIQASSGEGMSTSLLQAMSMKVPVIGSKVTGISNILGKKKYLGLLFNNNVQDLSKKIKYFYFLKKKIKIKFIKTQYNYVLKNHHCKLMFSKYLSIIDNEINKQLKKI